MVTFLIACLLFFSAFYKHGTPQNFWYKVGRLFYKGKIVVWKDGSYKKVTDGITWEYENDKDYLTTIPL